jgi:hypothetical protein
VRWALLVILVLHGFIHFLGPLKAFGLRELPELTQPVTRLMGLVWLVAGVLHLAAAGLLLRSSSGWWAVALAAVLLSQLAILGSWEDARYGTAPNVLVLVGALWGFLSVGPASFQATHLREAGSFAVGSAPAAPLTSEDLAHLPPAVERYLELSGALGKPPTASFHAEFRGRIRAGSDQPWMEFTAVQDSRIDPPTRLFHMTAEKAGIPVDVFHRLAGGNATFQAKLASVVPIVSAKGPEMDQGEAVTFFNDLCFFAPSALARAPIDWEDLGSRRARGTYALGAQRVTADLVFDAEGRLANFVSDDRLRVSESGEEFESLRWSTPVREFRGGSFQSGEALWHEPTGPVSYVQLELVSLRQR